MNDDTKELDQLQAAYKAAVERWITAIREEEALASGDHSVTEIDKWEAAHFREENVRNLAKSAKAAYEAGVRAGMKQWAFFPAVAPSPNIITEEQINDYLQRNPYPAGGSFDEQLEQISVQKWITLFGNDYEIYANWRRTGYPVLTPVNYPGNVTGGKMFRRFSLPNSENLTNQKNYLEALQRQGFAELNEDNLLSRVWWDK